MQVQKCHQALLQNNTIFGDFKKVCMPSQLADAACAVEYLLTGDSCRCCTMKWNTAVPCMIPVTACGATSCRPSTWFLIDLSHNSCTSGIMVRMAYLLQCCHSLLTMGAEACLILSSCLCCESKLALVLSFVLMHYFSCWIRHLNVAMKKQSEFACVLQHCATILKGDK